MPMIRGLAAAVAALFALFAAASCSGRIDATIRNDSSARMSLRLEVPEALAARVRQVGGLSAKASLFDAARLREEFSSRTSIFLVDVSSPSLESLTSVIWIPDLKAFVADTSLVPNGLVQYRDIPASGSVPAQKEMKISIDRGNAVKAYGLFPGIDPRLVDSLSPPALDSDPLTAAEYRMNLETVIVGKKAMPAFDACAMEITITAPKTILSSAGGTHAGQVYKAKIPLFDLLTLEKPISLALRWAE